jgi:hypothetical protein
MQLIIIAGVKREDFRFALKTTTKKEEDLFRDHHPHLFLKQQETTFLLPTQKEEEQLDHSFGIILPTALSLSTSVNFRRDLKTHTFHSNLGGNSRQKRW